MRIVKSTGLVLLLALITGLPPCLAGPVYISPDAVPWQSILKGPPEPGSAENKAEIDKLLEWQNKRTETDIARCKSEEVASPFIFSDVLGDKFKRSSLPLTADLLDGVEKDIKGFTKLAKAKWARRRPPAADSRIHPCVTLEENGSYPSAHAARGIVWASILSEIAPDKKTELMSRGRLIGTDRVIAGIHFPSDVEAGQTLGEAIFDKLMKTPTFREALEQAKKEYSALR